MGRLARSTQHERLVRADSEGLAIARDFRQLPFVGAWLLYRPDVTEKPGEETPNGKNGHMQQEEGSLWWKKPSTGTWMRPLPALGTSKQEQVLTSQRDCATVLQKQGGLMDDREEASLHAGQQAFQFLPSVGGWLRARPLA